MERGGGGPHYWEGCRSHSDIYDLKATPKFQTIIYLSRSRGVVRRLKLLPVELQSALLRSGNKIKNGVNRV